VAHGDRDAVTKDGWILGRKMLTPHDSARTRVLAVRVTKHSFHHTGAYTIPNLHFDGYVVFTNRVPTTAMRGFGDVGLVRDRDARQPRRRGARWIRSSCA
jgi:CO/xanthine dehydrogenase Mo-binding subunit